MAFVAIASTQRGVKDGGCSLENVRFEDMRSQIFFLSLAPKAQCLRKPPIGQPSRGPCCGRAVVSIANSEILLPTRTVRARCAQ